jgi:acyl-CoA thioesterase I
MRYRFPDATGRGHGQQEQGGRMLAAMKLGLALTVLPLGDSITEGVPTADGYRAVLRQQLADLGITVNYVGSLRSPAGAHEGWSGYTAGELLPLARATLSRARPDLVLLHIGTNDIGLGIPIDESLAHVRQLLELIDKAGTPASRPRVFLAKIIGRNLPFEDARREIETYNDRLAALAEERRRAGQPVDLVDLHAVVDPARHLHDALHPNAEGYARIAAGWVAAIRRVYAPRSRPAKK